jgi:purine-nucleoside/S-methyl-5'-thioadenosine phosphorylase / adenosine deaminase
VSLISIRPDWDAPPAVRAFTTTRRGGASAGPYASLNLGAHTDDDPAAVCANRAKLRALLPVEPSWLTQVHGAELVVLPGDPVAEADAALSRTPNTVCAVMTADCLPLLLCDGAGSVVAAVHCGWRGLLAGVIDRALDAMAAEDLLAWLGPAIGPAAYQIGTELSAQLLRAGRAPADAFVDDGPGKQRCDLYRIVRAQLAARGVTRVWGGDRCTHAEADTFFSHRRDGATGRQATVIWLE